jgi:DNA-binding LacI/PurR family transcriptional regulator
MSLDRRAKTGRRKLAVVASCCPAMGSPRVTSVDVAKAAGVSQSTVSLVFSGKAAGRISAATEASVRAVAADLGYRPNAAARALKTGAARTIALVVPDITNPFFPRLLRGTQQAAREAGYTVALIDTAHDHEWGARSAEALQSGPADGLLLFEVDPPPVDAGWEPIVVIESDGRGHPSVVLDVVGGTRQAVAHLQALGHTRIGHLTAVWDTLTFIQRREVIDAMVDGDVPRAKTDFRVDAARADALDWLRGEPDMTAAFCDDDVLAAGLFVAARELGIRIPEDLAVVGFGDFDIGRVLDPALTTIVADAAALGRMAFEVLSEQMVGGTPADRVLPVGLEVRGSTVAGRG